MAFDNLNTDIVKRLRERSQYTTASRSTARLLTEAADLTETLLAALAVSEAREKELREALKKQVIYRHERRGHSGTFVHSGYSCELCNGATDGDLASLDHSANCLLAKDSP